MKAGSITIIDNSTPSIVSFRPKENDFNYLKEQMADGFAGTSIFRISLTFTDRTLSVLQLGYKSEDSSFSIFLKLITHNNRAYVGRGSWKKLISPSFCHPFKLRA